MWESTAGGNADRSWEIELEPEPEQFYPQAGPWPFHELHLSALCRSSFVQIGEHLPIATRL